ncbi:MAG: glycosyltransferase family 2 protein [Paracoccaceae bacterium]
MRYSGIHDYLGQGGACASRGAVAILLMEDLCETNSTIRHHLSLGFDHMAVIGPDALNISPELLNNVHHVVHDPHAGDGFAAVVTAIADTAPNRWFYYGFNAEYLFYPFCESRSIGEMTSFVAEERRDSVLTYVVDLYARDLSEHPDGVATDTAYLDKCGYYSHARSRDGKAMERQLDMFGGLRWRFEEHVAQRRRKIDRISVFRAHPGLELRDDCTLSIEEMNTYSSPWHHSLTASIASFRAAKALRTNAGSSRDIDDFIWHNSEKFDWHSRQLLDLGLMEPGQWF